MGQTSAIPPTPPAAAKKSGGNMKLIFIIVAVAAIGGGAYFFLTKGKAAPVDPKKAQAKKEVPEELEFAALPAQLFNLADKDVAVTAKIGVSVGFADKKLAEKLEKKEVTVVSKIQDVLLTVISSKESKSLLTKEGKEALKKELVEALNKKFEEELFFEINFNEFYIQQ